MISQNARARILPLDAAEVPFVRIVVDIEEWNREDQEITFYPTRDNFGDIAPARTFVLQKDIEKIKKAGFAKGGSLENALVIGKRGPLNLEGARYPDEPARHKLVDAVGDFLTLGGLPFAGVELTRPGHHLLHKLVARLARCHRNPIVH